MRSDYKLHLHPPSCPNEKTFQTLGNFLAEIYMKQDVKHMLCGDFNVNFFHKGIKFNQLTSILLANGLSPVRPSTATRETTTTQTLLDLYFLNFGFPQNVKK